MTEPTLPTAPADLPDPRVGNTTGEGALTALAAMIRQRRMGGNHGDPDLTEPATDPLPDA